MLHDYNCNPTSINNYPYILYRPIYDVYLHQISYDLIQLFVFTIKPKLWSP